MVVRRCISAIFGAAIAVLPFNSYAVELKIFEWEGYISTFSEKFAEYAKSRGKDIQLSFRKNPDGTPFYVSDADQIFNAARSKESDIVTPTHNYYRGDDERLLKTLAPLDTSKLQHWRELPSTVTQASYGRSDGRAYAAPLLGGSYALAYNADRVKEPPTSWSVLFDPRNAGRVSVTSAQFEANVFVAALMTGHPFTNLYNGDNLNRAVIQNKLGELTKNTKIFWSTNPDITQMEQNLDYITDYWFGVAAANAKGQNWRIAETKEGETLWLDNISIASHVATDPAKYEAAHILIDFMLSPDIQAEIVRTFGVVAVNGLASSKLTPDEAKRFRVGDASFFKADRMWQPMPSRTRNLYRQMWKEALTAAGRADEAAKLQ